MELLAQKFFTDSESVLQFRRGLEEASKFLPRGNQLVIDLGTSMVSPELKGGDQKVELKGEKGDHVDCRSIKSKCCHYLNNLCPYKRSAFVHDVRGDCGPTT
jgi:hypothetical protein